MIVKQYAITLPADYDMQIIRSRVAARGPGFDAFPGLGIKTFLIREKGWFNAESNQYAPVYLWPSVQAIWGFVAGEGFKGILDSFGWTRIHHWWGLGFFADTTATQPLSYLRSVVKEEKFLAPGTDLTALRSQELTEAKEAVSNTPGLRARAIGLNPESWSLVHFDYWNCAQRELPAGSHSYEVLHVSAPGLDALRNSV